MDQTPARGPLHQAPYAAGYVSGMILYEAAETAAVAAATARVGAIARTGKILVIMARRGTRFGGAAKLDNLAGIIRKLDDSAPAMRNRLNPAPRSVDWFADAMKGWKDGEVIPESVLNRLSRRLNRNQVSVIQNEWALAILEKSGDGAQFVRFKDGSAGLLLRPDATRYQIVHELKHYEHWLADPKKYGMLSKLEREEFVFKALQESNRARLFNDAERAHALEYIEYLRKLYGN